MVKTRRSKSHSARHHRTRNSTREEHQESASSNSTKEESDTDRSNNNSDDETSSNSPLVKTQERLKRKAAKEASTSNLSLGINRLAVYSNRNMNGDTFSDDDNNYPSNSRTHHLRKRNRMLRRSALSLRPLSEKSYVDPGTFDSDSDAGLKPVTRRSRRVERSWLGDSQMHKVGYPNLDVPYSEEDSRDAADVQNNERATRHLRRRLVKPEYFYHDFEDVVPQIRRNSRSTTKLIQQDTSSKTDLNNKENKVENLKPKPGRQKKTKDDTITEDDESKSSKDTGNDTKEEKVVENGDIKPKAEVEKENTSSSVEDNQGVRTLRRTRQRQRVRFRNNSDNSESEEEHGGRKYSLRLRPKPANKNIQSVVQSYLLKQSERRGRGRSRLYGRRCSSSSSDSSSSSAERCLKTQKNQKSNHLKKEMMKSGAGGSNTIVPIKPETLDQSVRFSSIGGLDGHIQCLKEMILLPMMYPEVFRQFQVQPPRGVLFHGPPGTGKTLISRALAIECSSFGSRKISFFMRKGADLLSKWIGESEKQLRLLFEQAAEMKPSIIFFDELDGLAPVRSSRQDQVHASIVSTLLALMDGLTDRGEVIVIGATNRIDAIDPALRRPGRFDRELFFPLPSRPEREDILKVHVSKWAHPPSKELMRYLAENTVGYCGADLRALCSEAVIQSFKRTYPQVYDSDHRLLLEPNKVKVERGDFLRAKSMLVPASYRIASGLGKKLLPLLEPLLGSIIKNTLNILDVNFPHGLHLNLSKVKVSSNLRPAQLILTGDGPKHGQSNHFAPALLFRMEHIHSYLLDLAALFRESGRSPEEACIQIFTEAKRNIPSIIYIPNIDQWWELTSETVAAIFLSQLKAIEPNVPILFLATAETTYENLPSEIQDLFSNSRNEIIELQPPDINSRMEFFKLLVDAALKPLRIAVQRPKTPPTLPRANTPPPIPLTEEQSKKVYDTEEHTLRELRIFLRDMCKKLATNKLFFMFTKPVDTEEVPDYTEIIKQPMDLETMMMKVDFHRYECAKDFLIDIDLICKNALEYNPARSSADKQIRHRACSLRDYAYTLIKTEMDSDFEDKCQDIKLQRRSRKLCTVKYLPPYMLTSELNGLHVPETNVKDNEAIEIENSTAETGEIKNDPETMNESPPDQVNQQINESPVRKRKMKYKWQHGYLKKRPKRPKLDNSGSNKSPATSKNSSDESKNDPDSSTMEISVIPKNDSTINAGQSSNCDNNIQKVVSTSVMKCISPQKNDEYLISSAVLDDPFGLDDVDDAGEEKDFQQTKLIECPKEELDKFLEDLVQSTSGYSLVELLDLYNQLINVHKKYTHTHDRNTLPKDLSEELQRFLSARKDSTTKITNI